MWIRPIREAIRNWLLYEQHQLPISPNPDNPDQLVLPQPIDPTTAAGRKLVVTASGNAANIGTYTLTGGSGETIVFTPELPDPDAPLTIDLDTALAAIVRSWYWFSPGAKLWPVRPVAADCPAILMMPTRTASAQHSNVDVRWQYTLHFMLATSGRDPGPLEDLIGRLIDRLVRGRAIEHYRLGDSAGLQSVATGPIVMDAKAVADDAGNIIDSGVFWLGEFDLTLHVHRGPQATA